MCVGTCAPTEEERKEIVVFLFLFLECMLIVDDPSASESSCVTNGYLRRVGVDLSRGKMSLPLTSCLSVLERV